MPVALVTWAEKQAWKDLQVLVGRLELYSTIKSDHLCQKACILFCFWGTWLHHPCQPPLQLDTAMTPVSRSYSQCTVTEHGPIYNFQSCFFLLARSSWDAFVQQLQSGLCPCAPGSLYHFPAHQLWVFFLSQMPASASPNEWTALRVSESLCLHTQVARSTWEGTSPQRQAFAKE